LRGVGGAEGGAVRAVRAPARLAAAVAGTQDPARGPCGAGAGAGASLEWSGIADDAGGRAASWVGVPV
jgi:hypothetical protein